MSRHGVLAFRIAAAKSGCSSRLQRMRTSPECWYGYCQGLGHASGLSDQDYAGSYGDGHRRRKSDNRGKTWGTGKAEKAESNMAVLPLPSRHACGLASLAVERDCEGEDQGEDQGDELEIDLQSHIARSMESGWGLKVRTPDGLSGRHRDAAPCKLLNVWRDPKNHQRFR
ncbi:hypothetical protein BKA80DRAFT_113142 [Phyllosticta citrichinensis]